MQLSGLSEKESEVAWRLSSTSGCQAAGKPNVRGWPGGDGNSESLPKAWGSQGRIENQVQEQERCDSRKRAESLREKVNSLELRVLVGMCLVVLGNQHL